MGERRVKPSYCRDCKAKILWVVTANDKNMPVDWDPVAEGGNVEVFPKGRKWGCKVYSGKKDDPKLAARLEERPDLPLRRSHFQTCTVKNPPVDPNDFKDDEWDAAPSRDTPLAECPKNGLMCDVCRGHGREVPQVETPGGPSCKYGHGGAGGVEPYIDDFGDDDIPF